jgi:uncharacterized sulfatase
MCVDYKEHKLFTGRFIYSTYTGDRHFNIYPIRTVRTKKYKYIHNVYYKNWHTTHISILRKERASANWDSWDESALHNEASKKIIDKYDMRPEFEMYDLEKDLLTQYNLAGKPSYSKEEEKLKKLLNDMKNQQHDELKLVGEPYPLTEAKPTKQNIGKRNLKNE